MPERKISLPDFQHVFLDLPQNNRQSVLAFFAQQIAKDLNWHVVGVRSQLSFINGLNLNAPGGGIAIMDRLVDELEVPYFLLARLEHPVDFMAVDGHAVSLVCLMLSPGSQRVTHMRQVGYMVRLLMNPEFKHAVLAAPQAATIQMIFLSQIRDILAA